MSDIHILRTPGYYQPQFREHGHRLWTNAPVESPGSAEAALRLALPHFRTHHKRIRVLFVPTGDTGNYYEPHVVLEVNRT